MAKRKPNPEQKTLAGFEPPADFPADSQTPPAPEAAPTKAPRPRAKKAGTTEKKFPPVPVPKTGPKSVYLVDAMGLIYQVFHVLPEMSSPTGQPVGAVHGFIRDMIDIIQNKEPDYLVCVFDAQGDNFRHGLFPDYKGHREEIPGDLLVQLEPIQKMLKALAIPAVELVGYEADDILATMATQCEREGWNCLLVTGDKDCRQLISDRVQIYNIRKNEVFDSAALRETWGIEPNQVIDFQALVGDSVDNIPGVPLIGSKTATELLSKYRNLEGLFAALDEIPKGKKKDNLAAGQQQAYLSRTLAELKRDVPIVFDWDDGRVGGIDGAAVQSLCREFGFRNLAQRLAALSVLSAPAVWEARYETVATVEALDALVEKLSQQRQMVIDTETTSIYPRWAEIVGYAISYQAGEGFYIPVRAPAGEPQLPPDLVRDKFRGVLENPNIAKIGQNLKYDIIVLRSAGISLSGTEFDTMVANYLVEPGERSHNLDELAKRYLNHDNITIDSLIGTGKNQKRMDEVPVDLITQYAAEDADVPMRLVPILERRLKEDEVETLFREMEMPLVEVLAELEFNGIRIDTDLLKRLSEKFAAKMVELEKEIYRIAGEEFNINSPKQLATMLFEKLKLPVIKKTQTGASTDAEVLEELARHHELPAKIVGFRQYSKLKGTYVDALPQLVCPKTSRVHTSFAQDVAATGRLSSQDPNLQNIPVRTEEGREIRGAFLPGHPGWKLLCADYSQIELRVLAHFSKDATLQEAFASDRDIHSLVASQVYRVPLEEVNRDQRRSAKAINFGIIYGQSAFGLANALDIPKSDAQAFIDAYFERYPGVDQFMEETLDECRRLGYVKTIAGRRRPVEGVRDRSVRGNKRQRILPERIAVNSVIQGSAADLIKMAMIRLHRLLKGEKPTGGHWQAKMLLQIHDELVFEAPPEELQMLSEVVRAEMEGVMSLGVRLKVDVKAGDNWAECEEM